jgi:CRISPR/Cas system endoribonuclease Cas6 (RAMP superfamily)
LFDFMIGAPVEYQKIGYYCGFGKANSQGFGCVEVLN